MDHEKKSVKEQLRFQGDNLDDYEFRLRISNEEMRGAALLCRMAAEESSPSRIKALALGALYTLLDVGHEVGSVCDDMLEGQRETATILDFGQVDAAEDLE